VPFPSSLKTVTLAESFVSVPDGTPSKGTVQIVSDVWMQGPTADPIVRPVSLKLTLDDTGSFSVALPVHDDPEWSPQGWAYTVTLNIDGKKLTGTFQLNKNMSGTISLSSVLNQVIVSPVSAYLPLSALGAPGGAAQLNGLGLLPIEDVDDLQNQLDGKQNAGDYLTSDDISNLVSDESLNEGLSDKVSKTGTGPQTVASDLTVNGVLKVGSSVTLLIGADVNLYRADVNKLATDDALDVGGALRTYGNLQVDGTITNSALTTALGAKADLVGGVIPTAQIPAVALVQYLGTAANQAAMLAKVGQPGDWVNRTDLGTSWQITGNDPTQLSNWTQLLYPTAPVTSVSGRTGAVTLTSSDVGLGNANNTSDAAKPVSTAQQAALDLKMTRPGAMRSGSRYAPVFTTFAPATVALNEIRHVPIDFHSACTITELACEVTAAVASAKVRLLVAASNANGRPSGNFLYVSAQLDASTVGKVGSGVISLSIPSAGRYFFAALPQGVLPTLRSLGQVPAMFEQVSMATYNRCCYSEYGVTGTPVTVGTLSIDAGDAPRVECLIG
jgi:hypothetical protein